MLRKFDGALMINPDNRILILFHLYRSSKHKFIATVANVENAESCWHFDWVFLCILFLYIVYGWITILGYSKYELGTINLLYSNPKICYITPLSPPPGTPATSPQRPLSSVPKVAILERFDCIPVFSQTSYVIPTTVEALLATTLVSDQF